MKKIIEFNKQRNLNIRNHNNKIIVPKLKNIQKKIRKPITTKCKLK